MFEYHAIIPRRDTVNVRLLPPQFMASALVK